MAHDWPTLRIVAVLIVPAAFFTLLFLASVFERRLVRPYVPTRRTDTRGASSSGPVQLDYSADLPDPSQVSPYVVLMSEHIADAGYQFGGIFAHAKPKIRILATIWWSPARDVLALTGSGTVFGMVSKQSWLFTPLTDGRVVITTDQNDEGDLSGMYLVKRVLNVQMDRLFVAHTRHVQSYGAQATKFREATPADAIASIYERRVAQMVARGRAYYTDTTQSAWRYTAWGGLLNCFAFLKQLANALTQFWRVNKRPVASPALSPPGTYAALFEPDAGASGSTTQHGPSGPQQWR